MRVGEHYLLDICYLLQYSPGTHLQLIELTLLVVLWAFVASIRLIRPEVGAPLPASAAQRTLITFLTLCRVHRGRPI